MSVGYTEYSLNELGSLARGKSKHRPRNDPAIYGGSYPLIQTGDVKAASLHIRSYEQTYNDIGLKQSKLWDKGTLLITIAANIAETAVLDIKACFPDSIVGFIPNENIVDVYFIKYYIDYIKRDMQSISQGTTQDNLSVDKLLSFRLKVPDDRNLVKKISNTLLNYDSLIENNNRRIAILEEMAQSLYHEWFVRFRYPGHENQKLVESPLGLIPEGWDVKRLDDFLVLQRGFDLPKQNRDSNGDIPIYAASGFSGFHNEVKAKAPGIVTGRSGTLGIVTLILDDFWPLNTSLWIKEFKNCSAFYAYYLLMGLNLERFNSGSSVPTLNRNDVHGHEVIAPPLELIRKFEVFSEACHRSVKNLRNKNENLKNQRDMLLPKLISGQISLNMEGS